MEWVRERWLDANGHTDFDRSQSSKLWNTIASFLYVLVGVAATAGIIYTHLDSEHYDFSCISATQDMSTDKYHIGLCECTDTGNLQTGAVGAWSTCQSSATVPKCVSAGQTTWWVNKQFSTNQNLGTPFQGTLITNGNNQPCGVAEFKCLFRTCYPTGKYLAPGSGGSGPEQTFGSGISTQGGATSSTAGSVFNAAEGTFDGASNPAIKCCGFHKESDMSQALRVIGNIGAGGALGIISLVLIIMLKACMSTTPDAEANAADAEGSAVQRGSHEQDPIQCRPTKVDNESRLEVGLQMGTQP